MPGLGYLVGVRCRWKLFTACSRLGATWQELQYMPRAAAACVDLRTFDKVCSTSP